MKAHRVTPCLSALCVTIVTRTVLFLGVEIVPVDIVPWVCVPISNQILAPWSWPSVATVVSLPGWLCSTAYRGSAPLKKKYIFGISPWFMGEGGWLIMGHKPANPHETIKRVSDREKPPLSSLALSVHLLDFWLFPGINMVQGQTFSQIFCRVSLLRFQEETVYIILKNCSSLLCAIEAVTTPVVVADHCMWVSSWATCRTKPVMITTTLVQIMLVLRYAGRSNFHSHQLLKTPGFFRAFSTHISINFVKIVKLRTLLAQQCW